MNVLFNSLWHERERRQRRGGPGARKQQVAGTGKRLRYGPGLRVKSSKLPRIRVGPRTRVVKVREVRWYGAEVGTDKEFQYGKWYVAAGSNKDAHVTATHGCRQRARKASSKEMRSSQMV
ncbi:MAG TPA: hypothetical protein V6D08_09685 [Candidatus Obscuribacterales bacterium]